MSTIKTNVIGYCNSNDYPINIVIAEHNLSIQLSPKQFVVDRAGRRVNDPMLDKYVGKGRLSRATNPNKQVDVVKMVAVNHVSPTGQPAVPYSHAVSSAQGFVRDQYGQVTPVMINTAPAPLVKPPISYNPVRTMSVEEARKLNLIKPTRVVSEDFGADAKAANPGSIPTIQYQTDVAPAAAKHAPKEVFATPEVAHTQISEQMKAAQQFDIEDPNSITKMENAIISAAIPKSAQSADVVLKEESAAPKESSVSSELPEPALDGVDGVILEDNVAQPAEVQAEAVEINSQEASVPQAAPVELKCPICKDKAFHHPGYLKRHINTQHKEQAESLLKLAGLV